MAKRVSGASRSAVGSAKFGRRVGLVVGGIAALFVDIYDVVAEWSSGPERTTGPEGPAGAEG